MPAYANLSGRSGVVSYDVGPDYLDVTFRGGRTYRYPENLNGKTVIDAMKQMAQAGRGLATFIARNKNTLAFT